MKAAVSPISVPVLHLTAPCGALQTKYSSVSNGAEGQDADRIPGLPTENPCSASGAAQEAPEAQPSFWAYVHANLKSSPQANVALLIKAADQAPAPLQAAGQQQV